MSKDPLAGQSFRTRGAAEAAARLLGCEGVHLTDEGWMVCRSRQELDALLNGGVRAYRRLRREEKGLGRVVRAATPNRRNLRRVSINPDAEDRDGDGLVQEGTTAQRSAKKKPNLATPKKRVRKPTKPSVPDASVDEIAPYRPAEPVPIDDELRILDGAIKRAGGIGRIRTREEGPLPEVTRRMDKVKRIIERKYGRLETVGDMEAALKKAFPNAEVNITAPAGDLDDAGVLAGVRLKPKAVTNREAVEAVGGRDERTLKTMRGVTMALLEKAQEDPATAARIGGIIPIQRSSDYFGIQGTGVVHSVNNNIILGFNFAAAGENADNYTAVSTVSSRYLSQLRNIEKNQGTKAAAGLTYESLTNSDPTGAGMYLAYHEWTHAAGVASVIDELPPSYFEAIKEYVTTGKTNPADADGPLSTMLIQAFMVDQDIRADVAKVIKSLGADPKAQESWKKVLSLWGYGNVDPNDEESMSKVLRAASVRISFAVGVDRILEKRVDAAISDDEWNQMAKVSGYANRSREEAVAEFLALQGLHPDFVLARFGKLLDNEEILKRLK